jgi:hypothetical protein
MIVKTLRLLLAALLWAGGLAAQLPAGAIAPDFTATDINGQAWNLYDVLENDKIVLMEVSATWCPPCWAYHNSSALQTFYEWHGPNGDDAVRVFYVEGDPSTNVDCLYGTPACSGYSPGNYVTGSEFPFFDNAAIADSFQTAYYPTLFVICPNKKVYEINPLDAEGLWTEAQKCPVASGTHNAGLYQYSPGTSLHELCDDTQLSPQFNLINLGSAPLQSALIELKWNNSTIQTYTWEGNLPVYGEAPITLAPVQISTAGNLKTVVTTINGGSTPDEDFSNNVRFDDFDLAEEFNSLSVLMRLRTDDYANEIYWELRDEAGNVLDYGGNENVGPNGGGAPYGLSDGPGTYPDNALIKDTLLLPGPGCYSIHFVDAYGDGLCCDFGNGFYKLYNISNPVTPILSGGEYGAYDDRGFGALLGSVATQDAPEQAPSLRLLPNPATDHVSLQWDMAQGGMAAVQVFDGLGRPAHTLAPAFFPPGQQNWRLEIADWPPGMYLVELRTNTGTSTRRFLRH